MRISLLACLALIVTPATTVAEPLPPAGKWVVDFGDKHCIAQRIYGDPADPIYLLLKAAAVGDGLQVTVAKKGSNGFGVQEKAKLFFGTAEPLVFSQLRFGADKKQVRTVNLTRDQIQPLAGASALRWSTAKLDYSMPLGPTADLLKVMEKCRSSLQEYWNGTPAKKVLLKQGPTLNKPIQKLFSSRDYPAQAKIGWETGPANVVALIDEQGQMADCMVIETSGVAVLDAQTCVVIKSRGKFSAAIGADGKPAKSIFSQRVRWEMPE